MKKLILLIVVTFIVFPSCGKCPEIKNHTQSDFIDDLCPIEAKEISEPIIPSLPPISIIYAIRLPVK